MAAIVPPAGIADCDAAIQLDADDALAHVDRGAAFAGNGKFDEALADLDEAIRLDPELSEAYSQRAELRQERGDADGAAQDLALAAKFAAPVARSAAADANGNERR